MKGRHKDGPGERKPNGRTEKRWLDTLQQNVRQVAEDRREWGRVRKQAKGLTSVVVLRMDGWTERNGTPLEDKMHTYGQTEYLDPTLYCG